MNMIFTDGGTIVHAIQLAIAPAFLMTGMAALLNVLTNRMARIIDRYRVLERMRFDPARWSPLPTIEHEMTLLDRRARAIHSAIALCTASLLLICLVIIFIFLSMMLAWNLAVAISLLFILASLSLLIGLIFFLKEVWTATKSIYSVASASIKV